MSNDPQAVQDGVNEEKTLDELTKDWVVAVEAEILSLKRGVAQIQELCSQMLAEGRTIEERVAARIAKEELKILVDNASKGMMQGMAEAQAKQREEWERAMADFNRKMSKRFKYHTLISIGIALLAILACWLITVFGGVK